MSCNQIPRGFSIAGQRLKHVDRNRGSIASFLRRVFDRRDRAPTPRRCRNPARRPDDRCGIRFRCRGGRRLRIRTSARIDRIFPSTPAPVPYCPPLIFNIVPFPEPSTGSMDYFAKILRFYPYQYSNMEPREMLGATVIACWRRWNSLQCEASGDIVTTPHHHISRWLLSWI